uniref:Rho guanine nucleotide exchange factor (GEF) 1 n=1 Tax=Nothobranchius furzeri TaxID=105023 RepID=A0A8C6NK29_NOTFU
MFGAQGLNSAMDIIGVEDEDFENDMTDLLDDNCTYFNDMKELKKHPTHLLVFLHHVILQFDPAPLVRFRKKTIKGLFVILEKLSNKTASLCLFRQKRMMGMTPNESELKDVENHRDTLRIPREMKERSVAEKLLDKLFEQHCLGQTWLIYGGCPELIPLLCISTEGPPFTPERLSPSPTSPSPQLEEMEPRLLEFEQDPPNWRELATPDALKHLSKSEIKRQEVINELFATEHAHVRMLSVLQTVFSKPLEREELLSPIELDAIFPSLDDIIDIHYNFYECLKKLRMDDNYIVKSISTTLLSRFDGPEGEWFQKLTARFCSRQTWALDQLKSKQKKDQSFNAFIQDAESKPQCRRLQLKDIIPTEMQRLTKYPLLLENIAKHTDNKPEKERILKSAECCRKILNHVNEEVKDMGNMLTLKEYQKKLDTSGLKPSNDLYNEYKNIDLTQKKMLYEGPLIWKVTKEKAIEVQCVLLGDLLVLLQRQDDKLVLKCQSKSIAVQEVKQMLSPIIKLNSVFLRDVATDRKAFYVIFTWDSGAQIYELVAQSSGEMKTGPLSPTENGGLKSSNGETGTNDPGFPLNA